MSCASKMYVCGVGGWIGLYVTERSGGERKEIECLNNAIYLLHFFFKLLFLSWAGDVAELVEHQTGAPLTQVQFLSAARDFSPLVNLTVQTLFRCLYTPHVQLHALTSVCTLKILWSMSEFGGL